ncbi:hypothetical protein QBC42DRAFT_99377 [Cladorrhinum samala]|uniref:Uncharacterized protein n=1 Tax=Cladorrhinum samala TaxID=585594 RepID=A0AAV9HLR2_9PEZI|nr:hypothetical protein QBC42DRAFT_99377 [Cladorrhinum samala]
MPTGTFTSTAISTTSSATTTPPPPPPQDGAESGIASNKTLVIALSTVLSAVGLVLIVAGIILCVRTRRRRLHLFPRGISPIDDDEIATWKVPRDDEKARVLQGMDTDIEADAASRKEMGGSGHVKNSSTTSIKKPPSVIVYSNVHGYRPSLDEASPRRSYTHIHPVYGRMSVDKTLPQTPIQARAPNARAGLTDESVPGDEPFLPSPKRHTSRLSKFPPTSSSHRRQHGRSRSSRSSTRSFGEYGGLYGGSDVELSPRYSHDQIHSRHYHSRIYSSSSIPPRLSLGDEALFSGSVPARPIFRNDDIGRAIG